MSHPNLFDEAPSELSQDGFLCWVFKWVNFPGHPMAKVGRDLLRRILDKIDAKENWGEVERIYIRRQFQDVDILAVVEFSSDPSLCLVIEDKVDAPLSGPNQLEKNIREILAHRGETQPLTGVSRDCIHGVLLKAGYDFGFVLPPTGYVKISQDDLVEWTQGIDPSELARNNILRDWVEHFRSGLQHPTDTLEEASRNDNRQQSGTCWSDPVWQYKFFRDLFRVSEDQIVLVKDEDGQRIWLERQHEPQKVEFFHRVTYHGRPSIAYHFKFPPEHWRLFSYYYRLDWLQSRWGIALRFWKPDKSGEEIRRMYRLSEILSPLLRSYSIQTMDFQRKDAADQSIFLLIDPGRSAGLASLYDAHVEFVRNKATEQGLWHHTT